MHRETKNPKNIFWKEERTREGRKEKKVEEAIKRKINIKYI